METTETAERKRKNSRLDLRLSSDIKDLLQKAASVAGLDVSSFTLFAAIEKADEVLARHHSRILSDRDRDRLFDILEEEQPNPKLLMAIQQYKALHHG